MKPNTKYWLLLLLCITGYIWIGFNFFNDRHTDVTVCLIKNITGMPCPSCGITRSVVSALSGDLLSAIKINPLGLLALGFLILIPIWIFVDLVIGSHSLMIAFDWLECLFKNKTVYVPAIAVMLINWYWNIMKGL